MEFSGESRRCRLRGHIVAARGAREKPNHKRKTETTELILKNTETGDRQQIFVSISRLPNNRVSEIFINTSKTGSYLQTSFEAWAIIASLALQYGMPVSKLAQSISTMKTGTYIIEEGPHRLRHKSCTSVWSAVALVLTSG